MNYITIRDLQKYFSNSRSSAMMTMLQLSCLDTKMNSVKTKGKGGAEYITTIRHVNLDEAIMRTKEYLIKNKNNRLPKVANSMNMKREVVRALEVIKNGQV